LVVAAKVEAVALEAALGEEALAVTVVEAMGAVG
jgi:hypothetical protein